jgi:RecB family nuclease, putative, TM0106 family
MQKLDDGRFLYSASDLVHFLGCHHSIVLDLKSFTENLTKAEDSAGNKLLQEKGFRHEADCLQILKDQGKKVIEIPKDIKLTERVRLTWEALQSGAHVVYQGVLFKDDWRGDADFLIKVDLPLSLGGFSYEVVDTKLAKYPEPKHVIQLCVYADLLTDVQGVRPKQMHLVLGDRRQVSFKVDDLAYYYQHAKRRFETFVKNPPADSYPEPCEYCQFCHWKDLCSAQWEQDDHLSLVANIQRSQIDKLKNAGVKTVADLAALTPDTKIPDLNREVFQRLQVQASLQIHKRRTGDNKCEIISFPPGRGFTRLPMPDPGDLFFDMEGDPLHPNGLEYLFGLYYLKDGEQVFLPFWAHDHEQERETFVRFMEFLGEHLANHPNAHIYHYNHYETTALKRLACRYAVAEEQLDNLLRQQKQKFVDLYKVVRESIRVSEPGYSIKNLETFYMEKRVGAVATAGDSIVVYNRWREVQDDQLLQKIAAYNEVDCISTHKLRDWLVGLKSADCPWFKGLPDNTNDNEKTQRKDWEIEYEDYQQRLLEGATDENRDLRQRIAHLLEFHNREAKPQWWASFERKDKFEDELIDDPECLGGLTLMGQPQPEKRSLIYTYRFSPQEYKLKPGDDVFDVEILERAGTIVELDEDQLIVGIKRGANNELLPQRLSIGPSGPVNSKSIRAAIYRVADDILAGRNTYPAVLDVLNKSAPRVIGKAEGAPIIQSDDLEAEAIKAVCNLDNSYLFIQGPPGAGKTHTSAHIIVELLRQGKKVGVAANSHKAIHNLLDKIEEVAQNKGVRFAGVKKCSTGDETVYEGCCIRNESKTENIGLAAQFLAGTAWLFADERFDRHLDYLFIDEAGQVSLANVVAMGTSAKNIILVGDQMQLGQPIQGVHPGEAGQSVLEFLLEDHATIPRDRGIFLDNTRRLHPTICEFISDAFYDGRLRADPGNSQRRLIFDNPIENITPEGIHFLAAVHSGCSRKSVEEGTIIKKYYQELTRQKFQDKDGSVRRMTTDDVLVVTPYNVQVNYLKSILPEGVRVGTVDKFQGQEAPVVLVSMVTSSAEDLPRNIEFLYSKNRLNVALSRAQCLAVVVANPKLLEIPCKTIEQMKLVNTFCWLADYVAHQPSNP